MTKALTIKHRLDAGQYFNAYGLSAGTGWVVALGPVTDPLILARTETAEIADYLVAALRASHRQPVVLVNAGTEEEVEAAVEGLRAAFSRWAK